MREAHPREQAVGMQWYLSETPGIGGRLRSQPADFRVRERSTIDAEPIEADQERYPHLVFRATLRNWETNAFARDLANRLSISRERVQWAGTKDRRAVTTQLFSIDNLDPEMLPSIEGADIEVVGRFGRALQFGDLAGNEFTIRIRDANNTDEVRATTAELSTGESADTDTATIAVPNYFGHQRFGSRRPITHKVGFAILERDWEAAVRTYLFDADAAEPNESKTARETIGETSDWQRGLDLFPNRLRYERSMLHVLADGGSYRDALAALPENLRRLFVHAAQSWIFNEIVSRRLAAGIPLGEPVPGDIVCFTSTVNGLTVPDTERIQAVTPERIDTVRRHCRRGRAVVTAPLIGTETQFADGEPGAIAQGVLEEVGLDRSSFAVAEPYTSTGTRRAIKVTTGFAASIDAEGVEVEFGLPKGAYATVVLREYLKTDPIDL